MPSLPLKRRRPSSAPRRSDSAWFPGLSSAAWPRHPARCIARPHWTPRRSCRKCWLWILWWKWCIYYDQLTLPYFMICTYNMIIYVAHLGSMMHIICWLWRPHMYIFCIIWSFMEVSSNNDHSHIMHIGMNIALAHWYEHIWKYDFDYILEQNQSIPIPFPHTIRKFFVKGGSICHPGFATRAKIIVATRLPSCRPKGSEANPSKRRSSPTFADARNTKNITKKQPMQRNLKSNLNSWELRLRLSIGQVIQPFSVKPNMRNSQQSFDGFNRQFTGFRWF